MKKTHVVVSERRNRIVLTSERLGLGILGLVKTQLGFCFCRQDCSLFGAKDLLGVKACEIEVTEEVIFGFHISSALLLKF
ncbi:hypothetical protein CFP56_029406 [Quercus suber]|uniref:Uncharacterized protein n=1 Tax=Quercus suber TaxID=58331 RepID=A0AAW0JRW1_QUESU